MNTEQTELNNNIIPTKLQKPLLAKEGLIRHSLLSRLDAGLSGKLTLISAPAGFGKTTLINQWLSQQPFEVSWLALDKQDNTHSRFLNYLELAVNPAHAIKPKWVSLKQNSPSEDISDTITKNILQSLSSQEPFRILVLDDYHLITNPKIHDTIQFLINNLPKPDPAAGTGCHIMIITRADPPIPLSRWRLNGELNEIRTEDLRFSLEEAAILLNQHLQLGLSVEDVNELNSRAEGWVAGLHLTAVSLHGKKPKTFHNFIQELKGSYRYFSDYLLEEVFLQQTEEIQNFLLKTCILDRMNGDLCDEILSTHDSYHTLELLERNNVFLVPLDQERHWYRYHHFFADALQNRLKNIQKETIQDLHSKAASWFGEHNYIEESIKHWIAANEYDRPAELLHSMSPTFLGQGEIHKLKTLVDLFPDQAFANRPWMSIYKGWTCYYFTPDYTERWVEQAERDVHLLWEAKKVTEDEFHDVLGNVYLIRTVYASQREDIETTLSMAAKALKYLPEHLIRVRGVIYNSIGTVYMLRGEKKEALENFQEGKKLLLLGGNINSAANSLWLIGNIQKDLGNLHEASSAYKEAISLQQYHTLNDPTFTDLSYSGLGEVLFEWNLTDEAFSNLELGYKFSKQKSLNEQITCGTSLAYAYLNQGEAEKAGAILTTLNELIADSSLPPLTKSLFTACQIEYLSLKEDNWNLNKLSTQRDITLEGTGDISQEPEYTAYARSLMRSGQFQKALQLATNLEQFMAEVNYTGRQIQLLAIIAVANKMLKNETAALDAAAKAVNLAANERFIRTFMALGNPMLEILISLSAPEMLEKYGLNKVYLSEVIAAFLNRSEVHPSAMNIRTAAQKDQIEIPGLMVEMLTEREMEVLRLVAAEQSNSEIANHLNISVNTVKTHATNIYNKLGVSNRLQATNRARKLGLI